MFSQKNQIVWLILAVTAIIACLLATLRTSQDPVLERQQKGAFGTAQEAFDVACRALRDCPSIMDNEPIQFDPQFRATLHNQSKLWTINGYASCSNDKKKSYRWTVILNYHDMQEWETLARIVTPEYSAANSNQIEGLPKAQGKLLQSDGGHYRNRE
jgi:hypothetical protein